MHKKNLETSISSIEARITLSQAVRDAENQDGAVLLDVEQGLCLSLNVVGSKIWAMLKANSTGEQIVASLAQEFADVPVAQLRQDYLDFVSQIVAHKLAQASYPTAREKPITEAAIRPEKIA